MKFSLHRHENSEGFTQPHNTLCINYLIKGSKIRFFRLTYCQNFIFTGRTKIASFAAFQAVRQLPPAWARIYGRKYPGKSGKAAWYFETQGRRTENGRLLPSGDAEERFRPVISRRGKRQSIDRSKICRDRRYT